MQPSVTAAREGPPPSPPPPVLEKRTSVAAAVLEALQLSSHVSPIINSAPAPPIPPVDVVSIIATHEPTAVDADAGAGAVSVVGPAGDADTAVSVGPDATPAPELEHEPEPEPTSAAAVLGAVEEALLVSEDSPLMTPDLSEADESETETDMKLKTLLDDDDGDELMDAVERDTEMSDGDLTLDD